MTRPNPELEAAYASAVDSLGALDALFALYPGTPPELQAGVMAIAEQALIFAREYEPEPPTRKRSKANGVPMTGFEVPLRG